MKTKLKQYAINTHDGLLTYYATSAISAMDYFHREGHNVSLKDIIVL
jgi:hypothetical protein